MFGFPVSAMIGKGGPNLTPTVSLPFREFLHAEKDAACASVAPPI
jgi:hypothetical protein